MFELSPRLAMVASLVRFGRRMADIGTDHAYLPCELVKNGRIPFAIASDVAQGPLHNAELTVRRYGLTDRIECRRSDGLSAYHADEMDEIVLAGMGGNLIVDILSAVSWIKNPRIHLILQPMTHSEDVRRYLLTNGFCIEKETAVLDKTGKVYVALSAVFVSAPPIKDGFLFIFGAHPSIDEEASRLFVSRQINRLKKQLYGILCSRGECRETEEIEQILNDQRLKGY